MGLFILEPLVCAALYAVLVVDSCSSDEAVDILSKLLSWNANLNPQPGGFSMQVPSRLALDFVVVLEKLCEAAKNGSLPERMTTRVQMLKEWVLVSFSFGTPKSDSIYFL
jgi:hypothetical protein